jgi:mercuric reductase
LARLAPEGVRANGELLKADKTIVTTGASAAIPSLEGIDGIDYLTSTTALELEELPRSMLVIGGGYIGCELAQLFARAGVQVTLVCRSRLLPEGEPEISDALADCLREEGIRVRTGLASRHIRRTRGGIILDVGLHGAAEFVYMAAYGAKLAALNALNGNSHRYDAAAMPMVTFTDPQVASVGLTEAAAQAAGYEAKSSVLPLNAVPRALAARDVRGLIKLVADRATDRLLGAHILAPEGADSIQTAALAIKQAMTTRELGETIFPYLTTVEGLKLTALSFGKDVTRLSCCAG